MGQQILPPPPPVPTGPSTASLVISGLQGAASGARTGLESTLAVAGTGINMAASGTATGIGMLTSGAATGINMAASGVTTGLGLLAATPRALVSIVKPIAGPLALGTAHVAGATVGGLANMGEATLSGLQMAGEGAAMATGNMVYSVAGDIRDAANFVGDMANAGIASYNERVMQAEHRRILQQREYEQRMRQLALENGDTFPPHKTACISLPFKTKSSICWIILMESI